MEFLDRLILLSELEKSDVGRKILKLSEEKGELAEAYLVHSSAVEHPTKKFDARDVIEEALDVAIVALDVAIKMGAKKDEIIKIIHSKMDKWEKVYIRGGDES